MAETAYHASDDDKVVVSFFFSLVDVIVSLADGRLFFDRADQSKVFSLLDWFGVWRVRDVKSTKHDSVCSVICNVRLLCDVAWFLQPVLTERSKFILPTSENPFKEVYNVANSRRMTNRFRWFLVLSFLSVSNKQVLDNLMLVKTDAGGGDPSQGIRASCCGGDASNQPCEKDALPGQVPGGDHEIAH